MKYTPSFLKQKIPLTNEMILQFNLIDPKRQFSHEDEQILRNSILSKDFIVNPENEMYLQYLKYKKQYESFN